MTEAKAVKTLSTMLRVMVPTCDHEQTAKDLIDWYNVTGLERADLERLAALAKAGGFEAWDCPSCDDRVYLGKPKDWGYFQGVRNADYTSYPAGSRKQCDYCRCHYPEND